MEYRKTIEECKYFASDFNKFLNQHCTKKMTVSNIDGIQYKRLFKNNTSYFRLIEYKHTKEAFGNNQRELLNILINAFKVMNKLYGLLKFANTDIESNYIFQAYAIIADPPFERDIKIIDLITNKEKVINNQNIFIRFCNFELDFKDI